MRQHAILFFIVLLLAVGCSAHMATFQSTFFLKFSLRDLVQRNESTAGLDCSESAGGGMGMGTGAVGKEGSHFDKLDSIACQIRDSELFDEARFLQALKTTIENDLLANKATVVSGNTADPSSFRLQYGLNDVTGTVEVSATRGPAKFYTLKADLKEKSKHTQK